MPAISSPPPRLFLQQILQKSLQGLQKYGKEAVIGNPTLRQGVDCEA
jgi:hypothetical protein